MSAISSFRSKENKHDVLRGKDCMKIFCQFLGEHGMKIINFQYNKVKLLPKQQLDSYENAKICYNGKKKLKINIWKIRIS